LGVEGQERVGLHVERGLGELLEDDGHSVGRPPLEGEAAEASLRVQDLASLWLASLAAWVRGAWKAQRALEEVLLTVETMLIPCAVAVPVGMVRSA
jgi:hypothetical protein